MEQPLKAPIQLLEVPCRVRRTKTGRPVYEIHNGKEWIRAYFKNDNGKIGFKDKYLRKLYT